MKTTEKPQEIASRRRLDSATPPRRNGSLLESGPPEEADVGRNIQNLRKRCGLSIRQLAERAQVTAGIISCIERGKSSPSIATLHKIVTAMGSDLATFFSNGDLKQEGPIFRRERMQAISDGDRHYTIVLANAKGVDVEMFDEQIHPAGEMPEFEKLQCDVCGYLIAGAILLEMEGRPPETLRPGDAFFVPRGTTHRGYAVGGETARLITIHYPLAY